MSTKIYTEDGIKFELMKLTSSKDVAQAEKLKYKEQGYLSRIRHFYDKNGKVKGYGVLKSLEKKSEKVKYSTKKGMGIHPYSEFGFKPVNIITNRKYMYHAVCEFKYKKELTEGIYPPVFIATTPHIAEEIVKRVHSCNPKVLKIDISNLPIYKDLYWENDEREYEILSKEYDKLDDEGKENFPYMASLILHDENQDLVDLTKGNIFYIPKKVVRSRLKLENEKGNEINNKFYKLKEEFGYVNKINSGFGKCFSTNDNVALFMNEKDLHKNWKDKLNVKNLKPLEINKYALYTQKEKYVKIGKVAYSRKYIRSIYRILGDYAKIYQIPNLYLLFSKKSGYVIIITPKIK